MLIDSEGQHNVRLVKQLHAQRKNGLRKRGQCHSLKNRQGFPIFYTLKRVFQGIQVEVKGLEF